MLRDSIARCKAALPLPDLWRVLALPGVPRKNCHSPFRDDSNESFSVFEQKGLWFWRDHALNIGGDEIDFIMHHSGCDKPTAIQSYHQLANVPMPEKPMPQQRAGSLGKMIKTYDYRNAAGQLVHQTVRYEPKRFLQRRPAEKGMRAGRYEAKCDRKTGAWWIWTLEGIEPVLYRLPELLAADPSLPVFLCEGEKDADKMASWGAIATTAPMGAGKWRQSYTNALAGRRVIIVADSDTAGRNHALIVATKLIGIAKTIHIVQWETIFPDAETNKIDICEFEQRRTAAAA